MIIKWLGHSCFMLTDSNGVRILTDPCDPPTGYDIPPQQADAVTASHGHHDHNYFELVTNPDAQRITTPGKHQVKGVAIEGFPVWHDAEQGALRGSNIIYIIEMDGVRVMHCGDLGHIPDGDTLAALGRVDVLLLPIGGVYTIDYEQALELMGLIRPSVTIPMHYSTEKLQFRLDEPELFLNRAEGCAIHRMRQSEASITPDSLGRRRIIVLERD